MNYQQEAKKTLSDKFFGERVSYELLIATLIRFVAVSEELDKIKKTLFYGKDAGLPLSQSGQKNCNAAINVIGCDIQKSPKTATDVIHAIIGKGTESGELIQALLMALKNDAPFDVVNAIEEVGDGFWYDAILLDALGSNFLQAQEININKLQRRFPNAFSEYDANNRDLEAERQVLQNGVDTIQTLP